MNLKTLAQGFGAAIVVLILRVWPLLSSYHPVVYHSMLPMRSVIWGVLIDLAVTSLLAALLFRYLEASKASRRTILWALVAAFIAACLVPAAAAARRAPIPYVTDDGVFLGLLLAALALRWWRPHAYLHAVRIFTVLLTVGGCSLLWMIPELVYQGVRAQPVDVQVPFVSLPKAAVPTSPSGDGSRIVWLLFDELSYDQTFDHRFAGLALPALDAFKSSSLVFSNLQPAGYYTDRVIPSFFLGKEVDSLRSDLDGQPQLKLVGSKQWQPFDAHATLFADAQRLGWTTGVAGWYNPYCRILATTLNYCYWRMGDGQSDGALPEHSVLQNALAPVVERMRGWTHKPNFAQQKHGEDLAAVMPQAEALLRDQEIGFVFIHLPVPHPPNVYDRRVAADTANGSYIDNLAVADKALGQLMKAIDATPMAAKTTVIVCSDHSWRVPMWKPTGVWTREDQAASHGRFDTRPVLMIHTPGQQTSREVNGPFEELRLHAIIERLLQGQSPL